MVGKTTKETLFVGTIAQHSLAMSSPLFAIPDMTVREVKVTGNHMLTGKLRDQIDEIWANFWTGGIANPVSVIEQFTYLLFIRRLDKLETKGERQAILRSVGVQESIFGSDYLDETRFDSQQIQFVNTIIDCLTENGTMRPERRSPPVYGKTF